MALTAEEKEALSEHYKGRDLYDPSNAKEQEVSTFTPKMCMGGESGYADGGEVDQGPIDEMSQGPLTFHPADLSKEPGMEQGPLSQEVSMSQGPQDQPFHAADLSAEPSLVQGAIPATAQAVANGRQTQAAPSGPAGSDVPQMSASVEAPQVQQQQPAGRKLAPDEYSELVKMLSARQSFGQSAMTGLAGLADAIVTGVGRAPSPGFQKNIMETQQNQKQNLINALREKYEAGFKNRSAAQRDTELSQTGSHQKAEEAQARSALASENAQRDIENKTKAGELALNERRLTEEENKDALEQGTKSSGLLARIEGVPKPNAETLARAQGSAPKLVKTVEEWQTLPKGTHYVDAHGKAGIKR